LTWARFIEELEAYRETLRKPNGILTSRDEPVDRTLGIVADAAREASSSGGDPDVVLPADTRALSRSGLNDLGGSPTSPPDAAAVALARKFHDEYERLAPTFGYETREETREFDPDSQNGQLMVAVLGGWHRDVEKIIRDAYDNPGFAASPDYYAALTRVAIELGVNIEEFV
jgi:hypothetical protein